MKYTKAPKFKQSHKYERLKWAQKIMDMNAIDQTTVVFKNEKKMNLDGPNGLKYNWKDLRNEPDI